jgi:alpha-ketoglutarate-dependent taurine dioxygenase
MADAVSNPVELRRAPFIVESGRFTNSLAEVFERKRDTIEEALLAYGGVLFRGFRLTGPNSFHDFATSFGDPLLSYDFASTPRTHIGDRIYTSTEYPASQYIPLHNEQSYMREWPMRIWLHCVTPAASGGQTPIADSRRIYQRISSTIRARFETRRLMYVRNYGNGLDLPWQSVFCTDSKEDVERYCRAKSVLYEWTSDGALRTRQVVQATARHPVTEDRVWFNQAHLFHVSSLDPIVQEALLGALDEEDLPRNVYYGDGRPIETEALDEIRSVIADETISFDWRRDDVLMLDNMLMAHGRAPFKGERRVLVAMARPYLERPAA